MIDSLKIKLENTLNLPLTEGSPFYHRNMLFVPRLDKTTGEIKLFEAQLKNLLVRATVWSNKIFVENSIHKFYCGNNYSDFYYSMMADAFSLLSDELGIDVLKAEIKKMEYGLNINTEGIINPIGTLKSYYGNTFVPMHFNGIDYGQNCHFTQYTLKAYNKTKQAYMLDKVVIDEDLFRWEIKVNRMNALLKRKPPIAIERVSDLLDVERLQYLCSDLVERFRASVKSNTVELSKLSLREKTAYARMSSELIAQDLKQNHYETYKVDYSLYKDVVKLHGNDSARQIEALMIAKLRDLLNG